MQDASLHGRVAPKSKSINVDANLLSERLEYRERLRSTAKNRLGVLAIGLGLAFLALPPLYHLERDADKRYAFLSGQEKIMKGRLDDLKKVQDSAKPIIEDKQILDSLHRHGNEFLGQLTLFLNNVDPALCLLNLSAQVQSNTIQITSQANAVSYKAASDFVSLAAKSPNCKETVISSMVSNNSFSKDGVVFDMQQKLTVTP
jgi:Tfp pilus assembly protein PilN